MSERKNGKNDYPILKNHQLPVWKFYYQGHHSHPVRRTILVLKDKCTETHVTGYELREGSEIRNFTAAPIKTYRRSKIAKVGQCGRRLRKRTDAALYNLSTLVREDLFELLRRGA